MTNNTISEKKAVNEENAAMTDFIRAWVSYLNSDVRNAYAPHKYHDEERRALSRFRKALHKEGKNSGIFGLKQVWEAEDIIRKAKISQMPELFSPDKNDPLSKCRIMDVWKVCLDFDDPGYKNIIVMSWACIFAESVSKCTAETFFTPENLEIVRKKLRNIKPYSEKHENEQFEESFAYYSEKKWKELSQEYVNRSAQYISMQEDEDDGDMLDMPF